MRRAFENEMRDLLGRLHEELASGLLSRETVLLATRVSMTYYRDIYPELLKLDRTISDPPPAQHGHQPEGK